MKKLLVMFLVLGMFFPILSITALAGGPQDVTGHTFEVYIDNLYGDGVVSGYPDGSYRPNEYVKRDQMSKFIVKAFDLEVNTNCVQFPDVPPQHSFYDYITTLKCSGIVSGNYEGMYKPNDYVTRGAVTKFVVKAMELKGYDLPMVPIADGPQDYYGSPFERYINTLLSTKSSNGDYVISGYSPTVYKPDEYLTRGQMAKIVDLARKVGSKLVGPKEACENEIGGTWVLKSGITGEHECLFENEDAGNPCTDSSQCESFCIVESKDAEYMSEVVGVCHKWDSYSGCLQTVKDGKANPVLCGD